MKAKQDVLSEIALVDIAKDISQTYEEISAQRVLTTRQSVAQTRTFLDQVADIYKIVQEEYQKFQAREAGKKHVIPSAIPKNGKTVFTLLSANRGMYGDLPYRIAQDFVQALDQYQALHPQLSCDVLVIGKIGQYFLDHPQTGHAPVHYTALPLSDDKPTAGELTAIVNELLKYDTVVITYGKYESLLSLKSVTETLSGTDLAHLPINSTTTPKEALQQKYIIEPSVDAVAKFFETEIVGALFRQKVYEMQLARYASRMVAMESAISRAEERKSGFLRTLLKLDKQVANKKLQQIFAGRALWEEN